MGVSVVEKERGDVDNLINALQEAVAEAKGNQV